MIKTLSIIPHWIFRIQWYTFYWATKRFHNSGASREGWPRSVNGLLADFLTCKHMAARQTNSSRTRHQHHPRSTEVAAVCHFAFSYSHAAASEHMQYFSAPPLPLFHSRCSLFSSHRLSMWVSMWTCTVKCPPANYRSYTRRPQQDRDQEESDTFPAIWHELKPYAATVAWHGKKGWKDWLKRSGKL